MLNVTQKARRNAIIQCCSTKTFLHDDSRKSYAVEHFYVLAFGVKEMPRFYWCSYYIIPHWNECKTFILVRNRIN